MPSRQTRIVGIANKEEGGFYITALKLNIAVSYFLQTLYRVLGFTFQRIFKSRPLPPLLEGELLFVVGRLSGSMPHFPSDAAYTFDPVSSPLLGNFLFSLAQRMHCRRAGT